MTLAHCYIPEQKVVKSVTRKILLHIRPQNIEIFHLLRVDQYLQITYFMEDIWYRENELEVKELVHGKYLIDWSPLNQRGWKVDITQGCMIFDIGYYIILLSRVDLGLASHLETYMANIIEKIRIEANFIDQRTIISDSLHYQMMLNL